MAKLRLATVLLLTIIPLFLSGSRAHSQTAPSSLYSNFVGRWKGTAVSPSDGVVNSVSLSVSETKKHDKIRLDYYFGSDGSTADDTKFIVFDVSQSTMVITYRGHKPDQYVVEGFDQFSKDGLGSFRASGTARENGVVVYDRCFYNLEKDKFSYRWERSKDGIHFVTTNIFMFTRQPSKQ